MPFNCFLPKVSGILLPEWANFPLTRPSDGEVTRKGPDEKISRHFSHNLQPIWRCTHPSVPFIHSLKLNPDKMLLEIEFTRPVNSDRRKLWNDPSGMKCKRVANLLCYHVLLLSTFKKANTAGAETRILVVCHQRRRLLSQDGGSGRQYAARHV